MLAVLLIVVIVFVIEDPVKAAIGAVIAGFGLALALH